MISSACRRPGLCYRLLPMKDNGRIVTFGIVREFLMLLQMMFLPINIIRPPVYQEEL